MAGIASILIPYGLGVRRLWRSAGVGRGIARGRVAAFLAGVGVLVLVVASPLHALGAELFAAHMVQHLAIIVVAAPLLVLGEPGRAVLWLLPLTTRKHLASARWSRAARRLAPRVLRPGRVWVLNAGVFWFWHLPASYGWALEHHAAHALEHGTLLGTALVSWWLIREAIEGRLDRGVGILYVFAMGLQGSALGALLVFASSAWYPAYAAQSVRWGLTPLGDQQLGGLLMWLPTGVVYLTVAGILFLRWLDDSGHRQVRRNRHLDPSLGPQGT